MSTTTETREAVLLDAAITWNLREKATPQTVQHLSYLLNAPRAQVRASIERLSTAGVVRRRGELLRWIELTPAARERR